MLRLWVFSPSPLTYPDTYFKFNLYSLTHSSSGILETVGTDPLYWKRKIHRHSESFFLFERWWTPGGPPKGGEERRRRGRVVTSVRSFPYHPDLWIFSSGLPLRSSPLSPLLFWNFDILSFSTSITPFPYFPTHVLLLNNSTPILLFSVRDHWNVPRGLQTDTIRRTPSHTVGQPGETNKVRKKKNDILKSL